MASYHFISIWFVPLRIEVTDPDANVCGYLVPVSKSRTHTFITYSDHTCTCHIYIMSTAARVNQEEFVRLFK